MVDKEMLTKQEDEWLCFAVSTFREKRLIFFEVAWQKYEDSVLGRWMRYGEKKWSGEKLRYVAMKAARTSNQVSI
jgi:hypothetical protein